MLANLSPARRILLALGGLTLAAGIGLLIVGVMTASGGDGRKAVAVRDITPSPTRNVTPTPVPATATPVPTPPLGDQPYNMVIEKIGVDAPVVEEGLDENAVPIVPTGPGAEDIVVWYNFSARPGLGSNAVFAGHVTWNGSAVFFQLTSVVPEDIIRLKGTDGIELVYKVEDVFNVDVNDPNALDVMKSTDKDVITIITCDGDFVDTDDPVFGGDYPLRLVVRAALQEVVDTGQPAAAAVDG